MKKTTVALILIACLFAAGLAYALNEYFISTTGTYEGDVFSTDLKTINWGTVTQGTPKTQTVQITNLKSTSTPLYIEYDEMPDCAFELTSDAPATIEAQTTVSVTFTLTIYSGPPGSFEFKIYLLDAES